MLARGEGGEERKVELKESSSRFSGKEERSPTFLRRAFFATRKNREEKGREKKKALSGTKFLEGT